MNFQVLLSCPIPKPHQEKIPESVSIVESECEKASNILRVLYDKPSEMGHKGRFHLKSEIFLHYLLKIFDILEDNQRFYLWGYWVCPQN